RNQGEEETATDYLICLKSLYSRLRAPPSERHQVKRAQRGLRPEYWRACPPRKYRAYSELLDAATAQEEEWRREKMYRAPPSKDDSYVAECAYPRSSRSDRRKTYIHAVADDGIPEKPAKKSMGGRKSRSKSSRAAPADLKADDRCPEEEVTAVSAEEAKTRKPNEDKLRDLRRRLRFCYNCGETDHFAWTCPNPHRDVCPRCGTLGLTAITCTC
ncbi:GSCOCG00012375001-RA-CDS, partial [Cotesia congregata]